MTRTSSDGEIADVVEQMLRERLARFGFVRADVKPGKDHDGDPVLFIDAFYDLSPEPVDPAATLSTLTDLRARLLELGEERFPHIRHHFDERQKVVGFR